MTTNREPWTAPVFNPNGLINMSYAIPPIGNPNQPLPGAHSGPCLSPHVTRNTGHRLVAAFLGLSLALAAAGQAQTNYTIDWSTLDGGGGTSTGGVYTVSGTIGQPDAGAMSGGNYTLASGFWGIVAAVQTPGAPYLWVALTPTNTVVVWWALPETSWELQATTNLVTTGSVWTGRAYVTNGANCVYIESPPAGNRFYRLYRP